jgi:hypothetical protein
VCLNNQDQEFGTAGPVAETLLNFLPHLDGDAGSNHLERKGTVIVIEVITISV